MSIITVENLGKRYRIGVEEEKPHSFSGSVVAALATPECLIY